MKFRPLRRAGEDSPHGVVCSLSDVTESRRVATELEESERRFREVADNVDAVFWMRDDRTGEVLYVSDAYEQIWGRPVETVLSDGSAWLDAIHPDDRGRVAQLALDSKESGDVRRRVPDHPVRRQPSAGSTTARFSLRESSVRRNVCQRHGGGRDRAPPDRDRAASDP